MTDLRFDPSQLDKAIHSPIRLGVLAALYAGGEERFTHLRDALGATDGNLTIQMKVLEESGLVKIRKCFVLGKPRTTYRLTEKGRSAFKAYLGQMEALVNGCRVEAASPSAKGGRKK